MDVLTQNPGVAPDNNKHARGRLQIRVCDVGLGGADPLPKNGELFQTPLRRCPFGTTMAVACPEPGCRGQDPI